MQLACLQTHPKRVKEGAERAVDGVACLLLRQGSSAAQPYTAPSLSAVCLPLSNNKPRASRGAREAGKRPKCCLASFFPILGGKLRFSSISEAKFLLHSQLCGEGTYLSTSKRWSLGNSRLCRRKRALRRETRSLLRNQATHAAFTLGSKTAERIPLSR